MKIKFLLAAGFLTSSLLVFSQEKNYVEGDLLIQVSNNAEAHTITKDFVEMEMSEGVLISKDMNIWKFHYSNQNYTIDEAIERVYENNYVITAQRNHIIKHRATPDDTNYGQQWQYFQANDKDIDAPEAWDETTGGLTATGDTIVVCVIDDGAKLDHPDLEPNIWKNYNEIPNNGIDDDGNGYVDDVRGWNAYDNNDNPAHQSWWEGHGSAVAGIVGAKGNNATGVAGVNWDVKLMIVKGGGQEAQAIAAYSYPLANRKLYNTTNGAQGAFVVATNASWGIDNGQASQAPLWCAMYDTLGKYGILNAGATANANTNVDTQGDLPTQCPSEYLISVTNTDNTDTKVTQAGYGANSIDLGAPGAGAYTVAGDNTNGYGGFGGTSGATPHVTGTIGLLYSVDCADFANFAKTYPEAAAQKVRDYILNSVDPNTSLAGITTTGGRLNVNGAVQALLTDCPNIASLTEQELTKTIASIYPNPINGNQFNLQLNSLTNERIEVAIIDATGKMVQLNYFNAIQGVNQFSITTNNLSSGIYQVRIKQGDEVINLKAIK